jgi:hypothetical protein
LTAGFKSSMDGKVNGNLKAGLLLLNALLLRSVAVGF